ncbi:TonB-dependent siderophore receptor, partial [Steroidobacter sp.]|uniref:TonB-dependent siderophore receptor n=1 Tax=Steroidobacter sp. TaxID=1978227 RepID=UPI001A5FE35F
RPRAVTIVTRERLDEQNINTVNSVLDQSTGVTVARVNFANQRYYARGFQIGSLQVDGAAPIPTDGSGSGFLNIADLSMYEQVEVMRGPDALFSGNGASGGSLQLVRKRPTKDTQMSLALLAGSWSQYRAEIDASGPLGWDGRLRGRVVYAKEDSDSYLSNGESRRDQLYGIIEADLSDSTLLAVGGTYGNADNPQGSTGLPLYDDATDPHLPRSTIISPTWARQKRDAGTAFIQFEQRLGESWNLRANAMKVRVDTEGWGASSYNPINRQTGLISSTSNVSASEQAEDLTFLDLTLRGKFELFGYSQTVAVGVDAQDIRNKAKIWSFANFTNLNPFTYDPDAVPQPARGVIPSTLYSWPIKQDGAYLNLVLQVADPLKVMGGVRYSNYKYDFDLQGLNTTTGAVSFGFRTKYEESGVLTPYAGLTYELNSNWLLYGSIADQYQSQASSLQGPLPGTPVDPITGRNVEFGIKGGLWDGRAATQLAIYQIDRRNEAVRDLTYAQQAGQFGSLCCYLTRGTVQSRGADFEINGKLLANWDLFVGYTFNVNKYESGYANGLGQKYNPQTPKHLLKLWTTYGLPHNEQWKFSLGVVAQSENYVDGSSVVYAGSNPVGTSSFRFTAGAYAIVGARVAYDINPTWSVALNADNIFDKVYYKTIGVTGYGTWYGDPRSFTLSLRSRW